jgi:hypothetical protein
MVVGSGSVFEFSEIPNDCLFRRPFPTARGKCPPAPAGATIQSLIRRQLKRIAKTLKLLHSSKHQCLPQSSLMMLIPPTIKQLHSSQRLFHTAGFFQCYIHAVVVASAFADLLLVKSVREVGSRSTGKSCVLRRRTRGDGFRYYSESNELLENHNIINHKSEKPLEASGVLAVLVMSAPHEHRK